MRESFSARSVAAAHQGNDLGLADGAAPGLLEEEPGDNAAPDQSDAHQKWKVVDKLSRRWST
jgi:hypothetical protein